MLLPHIPPYTNWLFTYIGLNWVVDVKTYDHNINNRIKHTKKTRALTPTHNTVVCWWCWWWWECCWWFEFDKPMDVTSSDQYKPIMKIICAPSNESGRSRNTTTENSFGFIICYIYWMCALCRAVPCRVCFLFMSLWINRIIICYKMIFMTTC